MNEEKIESENVQETSLKGVIIFLIIFGIIAVTLTSIYANIVKQTNNSTKGENVTQNTSGENEKIEEIIPAVDTKYISEYDEMYSTNAIEITTKNYLSGEFIKTDYDGDIYEENIEYFQIDGLKDEELERKINERIKNDAIKLLSELPNGYKVKEISMYESANFSNILSYGIECLCYNEYLYEDTGFRKNKHINIDLSTGNDIKFEDLFLKGTSIKNILSDEIYKNSQYTGDGWEYYDYLYNEIKNDEFYRLTDEEIKKMGLMTRDEWVSWYKRSNIEENAIKMMYEISKNNFDFYINSYAIHITTNDLYFISINLRNNLKRLAIFKRFMKEESIFTNEYPTQKSMCGFENDERNTIEKVMDNLILNYGCYVEENIHFKEMAEKKIEAEKKYARLTPNKMHIVGINVMENSADSIKVEIAKNDFDKNKDEILKVLNPYWYYEGGGIVRKNVLEELEINYTMSGPYYIYKYESNEETSFKIDNSDTQIIDESVLIKLSDDDLNIAYNEIFARHGHDFQNKTLREHFIGCVWYCPIFEKTVSLEELNEIEKQNIEIIRNEINRRKGI